MFKYFGVFVRDLDVKYVGGKTKKLAAGPEKLSLGEVQRIVREELGVKTYQLKLLHDEKSHYANLIAAFNQGLINYYIEDAKGLNEEINKFDPNYDINYNADVEEGGSGDKAEVANLIGEVFNENKGRGKDKKLNKANKAKGKPEANRKSGVKTARLK